MRRLTISLIVVAISVAILVGVAVAVLLVRSLAPPEIIISDPCTDLFPWGADWDGDGTLEPCPPPEPFCRENPEPYCPDRTRGEPT